MSSRVAHRGRWLPASIFMLASLGVLLACGARADGDEDGSSEPDRIPDEEPDRPGEDDVEPDRDGAQRPSGLLEFDTSVLPECRLGFRESSAGGRRCDFKADGRCYEQRAEACACVCPTSGTSRCVIGGFLSAPGEPLDVLCYGT